MKLFLVLKETLAFHQWLKMGRFPKSDFQINGNNNDSRASRRIKNYPESYKQIIHRGSNSLKTPKFHQMLLFCDYIKSHGTPLNFDGSRGDILER